MEKYKGCRKSMCFLIIACFVALVDNARADVGCSAAEVTLVGQHYPYSDGSGYSNITRVQLTNKMATSVGTWAPNTARYFFVHKELGNAGLATLLTASATGRKVNVMILGDGAENSLIRWIYLGKN